MIRKKVCLLGAFGVGKTSLVRRFVSGIFSDKYLSTMGVKIDRKTVDMDGREVGLMIWDIHGEEAFRKIPMSYLRGASGLMMVVDGTRPETLDVAAGIAARVDDELGLAAPRVWLANKRDLADDWVLPADAWARLAGDAPRFETSALSGEHVDEAFRALTRAMLA